MSYTRTTFVAIIAAALVLGVWGGEPDLAQQTQQDFDASLFAREIIRGPAQELTDLNIFKEELGGAKPVPILLSTDVDHPYSINGKNMSSFNDAINQACVDQKNACAKLANENSQDQLEVSDCDEQQMRCNSTLSSATQTVFLTQVTMDGEAFICEN